MPNQVAGDDDACQLKAGHPPAVKVGNMRVTQRTHSSSSTSSDKKEDEKSDSSSVPSACSFAPKTVVKSDSAGVVDKAVTKSAPEAVKQIHEKPQVSHDSRSHSSKPNVIQQPRK